MTDAGYRKKIDLHLVASYGDTFAEASYWNKNPDDKLFFAQIFRMAISAAALESGTTTPPPRAYSRDDVAKVFVKIGKHMNVDEPALERLGCTKSILRSFLGQTPAAEPPGGMYIIVPPPSPREASGGARATQEAASTAGMKELQLCNHSGTSPVRGVCRVRGGGEVEEWEEKVHGGSGTGKQSKEAEDAEEKKVGRCSCALTSAAAAAEEFVIDVVTTDDETNGYDDDGDDVDSLCGDDDAAAYLPDLFDYLSSQPMESGASQSFNVDDLCVDEAPTASQPSEYAVAAAAAAAEAAAREIALQEQERLDTLCKLGKQLEMFSAAMSDVVCGGDARRSMSEHVAALQQLMNKQVQQANAQLGDLDFLVGDVGGEENRDGFLDAI